MFAARENTSETRKESWEIRGFNNGADDAHLRRSRASASDWLRGRRGRSGGVGRGEEARGGKPGS